MRDLDIKSLRLLVTVCDHRSMKHAALQEHIEPSAVSKRIAQLEDAVGVPLLVRGRQGVEPTAAGRAFLEQARGILFALERLEGDMAAFKGGVKGHVRLAASTSAIAESLLDDLAMFMRLDVNRHIRIDIEEHTSTDIVTMVREGAASLGVCWDQVEATGLKQMPYRSDRIMLAVPRGHPLAGRRAVNFVDTLDHEHVGMPPYTSVLAVVHRVAALAGRKIQYRVVVSSIDSIFRVVAAGLAIGIVPIGTGIEKAFAQEICLIPLKDAWAERRFAIFHRGGAHFPSAASLLAHFLAERGRESVPVKAKGRARTGR